MKRVFLKGVLWAVGTFLGVFGPALAALSQAGPVTKEGLGLAVMSATAATVTGLAQYIDKTVANEFLKQNEIVIK